MKRIILLFVAIFIFLPVATHASGFLIKSFDSPKIYYLEDKKKYHIPNEQVFFSWFDDFSRLFIVSESYVNHFPEKGKVLSKPGETLIKEEGNPRVYAIAKDSKKIRWVKNQRIARSLFGQLWWKKIVELDSDSFDYYCIGNPISSVTDYEKKTNVSINDYLDKLDNNCKQKKDNIIIEEKQKTIKIVEEKEKDDKQNVKAVEDDTRQDKNSQDQTQENDLKNTKEESSIETQKEDTTKEYEDSTIEETSTQDGIENMEEGADTNTESDTTVEEEQVQQDGTAEETDSTTEQKEETNQTEDTSVSVSYNKIPNKNTRAMWVWERKSVDIVKDQQEQDKFFNFIKTPHGDSSTAVTRLFFFGDHLNLKYESDKVASFVKRAHENGVAVEYLAGRAYWVQNDNQQEAISRCEKVVSYNSKVEKAAQFDGVHFDIEPHQLGAAWRTNNSSGDDNYNDDFENNYVKIMNSCRDKFDESGQNLSLGVDLGTDYSYYVTDLMDDLDRSDSPIDYITLMNYFDTADRFINGYSGKNFGGVKHNIRLVDHLPLVFGAETGGGPADPITFAEEGVSAMENVFDKARADYGDSDQFAGFSVHYYNSYSSLKKS